MEDYEEFINTFQKMVNGGSIGQFGNATTLHKIAFPPAPRNEGGGRGRERGGSSGRGNNDHQHQAGGRGRGGRGGGGRGQGDATPHLQNNPSGLTAPKVFAKANPGVELNFRDIRLPQVRCNGSTGFLCGAAHIEGMNCTRSPCRFLHLPPNGLAALDQISRDRVYLCVRSTSAITFARGHQPPTGAGTGAGTGTGGSGTPTPPQGGGTAGNGNGTGATGGTSN